MTHEEIKNELSRLIQNERANTKALLIMLKEAEDRRSYVAFEYVTLYDWLVRGFKYSTQCAMRRLDAVRLMRAVPSVQNHLENGALNLTVINKLYQVLNAQEKATVAKLSNGVKADAVNSVLNLSTEKAEAFLLDRFPDAAPDVTKPKKQRLKNGITRISINLTEEDMTQIKRAKELASHSVISGDEGELFLYLVRKFNQQKDPVQKTVTKRPGNRPSLAAVRRDVYKSTHGGCSHEDSNGQACDNRFQVQVDHRIAKAKGGSNSRENLRPLCRHHNILEAEKVFGEQHMSKFRRRS